MRKNRGFLMLTVTFKVSCSNPDCKNFDITFNEFSNTFEDEDEENSFLESFGHGGEDDTDYCPTCKSLGELILPVNE